jgi:hypothetical protein
MRYSFRRDGLSSPSREDILAVFECFLAKVDAGFAWKARPNKGI